MFHAEEACQTGFRVPSCIRSSDESAETCEFNLMHTWSGRVSRIAGVVESRKKRREMVDERSDTSQLKGNGRSPRVIATQETVGIAFQTTATRLHGGWDCAVRFRSEWMQEVLMSGSCEYAHRKGKKIEGEEGKGVLAWQVICGQSWPKRQMQVL